MTNDLSYLVYLFASIAMTVWVARTLSRNGEVFLVKCFGQDEVLARSTNHLLVVGFYLINLGFIGLRLDGWNPNIEHALPYVGSKIGLSILVLGAMHFFNMLMIARFGRTVNGWVRATELPRAAQVPPPR
jgi:hypothetical protein